MFNSVNFLQSITVFRTNKIQLRKMNIESIEHRIQNLINQDQLKTKRIALRGKKLNQKIIASGLLDKHIQTQYTEKRRELNEITETVDTLKEVHAAQEIELIRLRQQVQRLRKKKRDILAERDTTCIIGDTDRTILCKKLFKVRFLHGCIKLTFSENKSLNRVILKGFVTTADDMIPFEKKFNSATPPSAEILFTLWDNLKRGSEFINDWNQLLRIPENQDRIHETF